ncbi:MaoC family dehydratase N-terminal domain-containing protein [Chloroflexota bacterium]
MATSDLSPELKKYIGLVSFESVEVVDEVNKPMIRMWCEMVEDTNPLYTDEEYATRSEYGCIVSPPTMIMTWGLPPEWPASEIPPHILRELPLEEFPVNLSVGCTQEYFQPARRGDRLHYKVKLDNISPLKKTRIGYGHFVTTTTYYYNQQNELVAANQHILFRYRTEE